ncbi:MAG TPA: ABC transporter ATP-binding protein, partial [Saprospiraceae bacterium]|nr:ABC transporter ATP-binding protein [Saprospiraceae bacterium]
AYMYAPYTFILNRNSAELMRNVQIETKEIIQGIIIPGLGAFMGAIMTLFTAILLIVVTPWVALVGVVIIGGGSALFFRVVKNRLKRYGLTAKEERKETLKAINHGLGGLVDARMLRREPFFISYLTKSVASFARVNRLRQVIAKASPYILETISVAGLLLIVMALLFTGRDAASLIPTLALFGVATMRLRQTVSQIVSGITQIQYSLPAIGNVLDDLQELEHTQKKDLKKKKPAISFQDSIRMEGISFTYPNADSPALQDIDLTIRRGESVAFVGATGSGKSTIVNIILGLLEPTHGKITVDGVDIRDNPTNWRSHIGYIPQSIFLTDDTIARNIAFGLTDAEMNTEQLWTAIRAAQLEDFILSLPQREQTIVGERGVRLSGGQRQRIGLARALYHNPDILIMDEATSALDNQTESLVMEALENLRAERTFIMIAHRLSTVEQCDRLYYLQDGSIAGIGTFSELALDNQYFREMVEAQ